MRSLKDWAGLIANAVSILTAIVVAAVLWGKMQSAVEAGQAIDARHEARFETVETNVLTLREDTYQLLRTIEAVVRDTGERVSRIEGRLEGR